MCYRHLVMNLLWRSAHETKRQLGINIPIAVMAILSIGVSIVIVTTFSGPEASDPKTESITGFLLWFVKVMAWIGTLVAVFVPLLAWNMAKVARRDRSASAHLKMAAESAASVDVQMKASFATPLKIRPTELPNAMRLGQWLDYIQPATSISLFSSILQIHGKCACFVIG